MELRPRDQGLERTCVPHAVFNVTYRWIRCCYSLVIRDEMLRDLIALQPNRLEPTTVPQICRAWNRGAREVQSSRGSVRVRFGCYRFAVADRSASFDQAFAFMKANHGGVCAIVVWRTATNPGEEDDLHALCVRHYIEQDGERVLQGLNSHGDHAPVVFILDRTCEDEGAADGQHVSKEFREGWCVVSAVLDSARAPWTPPALGKFLDEICGAGGEDKPLFTSFELEEDCPQDCQAGASGGQLGDDPALDQQPLAEQCLEAAYGRRAVDIRKAAMASARRRARDEGKEEIEQELAAAEAFCHDWPYRDAKHQVALEVSVAVLAQILPGLRLVQSVRLHAEVDALGFDLLLTKLRGLEVLEAVHISLAGCDMALVDKLRLRCPRLETCDVRWSRPTAPAARDALVPSGKDVGLQPKTQAPAASDVELQQASGGSSSCCSALEPQRDVGSLDILSKRAEVPLEDSALRKSTQGLERDAAGPSDSLQAGPTEGAERATGLEAQTRARGEEDVELLPMAQSQAASHEELPSADQLGKLVEQLLGCFKEAGLEAEEISKLQLPRARAESAEAHAMVEALQASLGQVSSELANSRRVVASLQDQVTTLRGEAEQREASLRQANKELTNTRKMVASLQDNVAELTDKLQAGVRDAKKYKGAPPLDFYDAVLTIPRLEDVYHPDRGWRVEVTRRREFDFAAPLEGVRVIPLGHFNSGKTWLIAQLSGTELPKGATVHTEGISIKEATADKLKILLLDTVGSNSPMDTLPQGVEDHSASRGVEAVLQELRVQEDFFRQLCFEVGQVILLVVGQMSHKDQSDLVRLARAIRKDRVRKDVVVVHNLRDWNMEMLGQKSGKDGMSYVERTQALFGLADVSLEVTIGETKKVVTRHQGLFEAEGGNPAGAVQVYHYYLTDNRLPCNCNMFAIKDIKTIITTSGRGTKSLADEFAAAATKIQGRFASFNMDEPKIVFDPEASRFRIQDPIPDGAYRMKPRDLGSYFTMGSDEPPHSITLVPATVKATTGRGQKKEVTEQSRNAYHLQMELPGLCSESLADIKKQIEGKDAGGLRKEQLEGGGGVQWTVSFQATLLNIPGELYGQVAEETDIEVQLSPEVTLHVVHDEGTRHHFQNGIRTVKVTLHTGITDYDSSEDPIVTYVDGVLGITLIKESRC